MNWENSLHVSHVADSSELENSLSFNSFFRETIVIIHFLRFLTSFLNMHQRVLVSASCKGFSWSLRMIATWNISLCE